MSTTRRTWLKRASLSLAGAALLGNRAAASPFDYDSADLPPGDIIKLTSNENPYGPPPLARKAMAKAANISNRYPWDDTLLLREKTGTSFGLTKDHVIIGAGSSEILGLVGLIVAKDKGHFVSVDLTFRIWRRAAIDMGATVTRLDLTADKKHDLAAMEKAVTANTKLIYICNPNNPTGTIVDAATLRSFIDEMSKKYLIVIDEAYLEYTGEPTMAGYAASNKNVIVIKTFSKIFGLAGARIGYALAHPDTIKLLNSIQPWPNAGASACAVAAAGAALDDKGFLASTIAKNNEVKKVLCDFYSASKIPYIESHTNFVYYSMDAFKADIGKELENRKIFCGGINEEKGRWYRVTVGTANEMAQYVKALTAIINT